MKIEEGADYTWCEICGEKLPYYIHLCPRCQYMLLALRQKMDRERPITEKEAEDALIAYYQAQEVGEEDADNVYCS